MLSYATALADFAQALEDPVRVPNGLADAAGLAVYRNNVLLNRVHALTQAYPTVAELVGEAAFAALARDYVRATPAESANLHDDGAPLAAFLAGYTPAAGLPYLADVARFDWARHRAYYAADVAPLDPARLAGLDAESLMSARLRLHPSLAVVASSHWPVADIQVMHEGGMPAALDAGAQTVMVWRAGLSVCWRAIDAVSADLLQALLSGQRVGEALTDEAQNVALALVFAEQLVTGLE